MKTKICTVCNTEYDATLEYWHKQKNGKFGLRAVCKICICKAMKEYRKTPTAKEANRINQAKWRAQNPDKSIEISRRCYNKNADRINAAKRERLKIDPDYKAKIKERERRYVESGRRHEMNSKPEIREKARIRSEKRRKDPAKKANDYNMMSKWRDNNREYLKENDKKRRIELASTYIATCMKKKISDLTPEIIETKRIIIQLKRELKNNNVKIK